MKKVFNVLTVIVLTFGFFGSGCISAPPKKPNLVEQLKRENEVASKLARTFESSLKFVHDPQVDIYLEKITQLLTSASGDPRLADTGVVVIQDRNSIWRSYNLPGHQVYLSLGRLQQTNADSEVAALIAVELAHIQNRHVLDHIRPEQPHGSTAPMPSPSPGEIWINPASPVFFGHSGLFEYNKTEMSDAIHSAVDLLYRAGFDSRGLITNFENEEKYSSHSFYTVANLEDLIQNSREMVSNYPPLRNPIVRTQEFAAIRKRIKKL